MPRPDITLHASAESRRKGALAAAERKRELGKTVRERLAEIAQDEAERIASVYLEAMEAADEDGNPDHRARESGRPTPFSLRRSAGHRSRPRSISRARRSSLSRR